MPWTILNGIPLMYTDIAPAFVIFFSENINMDAVSNKKPYIKNVEIPPYIHKDSFFFFNIPFLNNSPAINPIIPKPNICHGVQGPCPKKKLDTIPETAPTKKPASPPKQTPAIITMAATGLN